MVKAEGLNRLVRRLRMLQIQDRRAVETAVTAAVEMEATAAVETEATAAVETVATAAVETAAVATVAVETAATAAVETVATAAVETAALVTETATTGTPVMAGGTPGALGLALATVAATMARATVPKTAVAETAMAEGVSVKLRQVLQKETATVRWPFELCLRCIEAGEPSTELNQRMTFFACAQLDGR